MGRIIQTHVDDATLARLTKLSEEMHRTIEDLAECAVSEEALKAFRHRNDDPAN